MICGFRRRAGAPEPSALEALLAALPGPETGVRRRWARESVAFGWRGSAFAGAEWPCVDEASGLALVASVRLDGRAALCEALGIPALDAAGPSDGALILRSYARWGRACPERLLGDYAFALWDARRQVLFCARDHVGARPFYYAAAGEHFVFGSDIDAVLAGPGVSAELDEAAVATRLTDDDARPLGDRTLYRAVRRLLPGHALRVEGGAVHLDRWWRPEDVPPAPAASDDALAEECLALVSEAVRDRLRGARSVGVHLSGGLDSSGVAVLAARELRRRGRPAPPAFAWQPPPTSPLGPAEAAEAAEYGAIESICRQEGLSVHYVPPRAADVVAFLRRDCARGADEGTLVHEEVVQRAAAGRGVQVLLSGWGGDEGVSFNGRGYYRQLLRRGRPRRLWRELRTRTRFPLGAFLVEAAALVAPGAAVAARRLRRGQAPFRKRVSFIDPAFARRTPLLPAVDRRALGTVRELQLHLLRFGHLSRRMEGWAASGARHGIEYGYPLLDRRVVEFALGLPPEQYRRGVWSRWLMRRALAPVLPPEVCWNRSKADPARFGALRAAVAEALPTVRGLIEERAAPPPRSRYLDLPRLLVEFDPARWRPGRRFPRVVSALRFLDF